jgi:hypothetical protein
VIFQTLKNISKNPFKSVVTFSLTTMVVKYGYFFELLFVHV